MASANFVLFDLISGDRTLNAAAISAILEADPSGLQGAALASAMAAPPAIGGSTPANGTFATLASTGSVSEGATTLAAAGATQGNAASIPAGTSVVYVTVTASTQGVKLPTAVAGKRITVLSASAVGNKIYPATGALIQGAATNASITLAANKGNTFYAESATKWRYVKGA